MEMFNFLLVILLLAIPSTYQSGTRKHKNSTKKYAVVIDAGSTGSRVTAYEFEFISKSRLILKNEIFHNERPALAALHNKTSQLVKQMKILFGKANELVPKRVRKHTPIVLKATAGLRLLPHAESDSLLDAVRSVLLTSGYYVGKNAVEIMDAADEGIFSWFAVNYLLGRLGGKQEKTVATMEMGGASTQVTFLMKNMSTAPSLAEHVYTVSTFNNKYDVFTHSYLNLGAQTVENMIHTYNASKDAKQLNSICVNPAIQSHEFKYGEKQYILRGANNSKSTAKKPVVDFDACISLVRKLTLPLVGLKPVTLNQHEIYGVVCYFFSALNAGLVGLMEGGVITVDDYRRRAMEICQVPDITKPHLCVSLIYISVLLTEGYGLNPNTKINLYQNLNGHHITWALGCAYQLLVGISRQKRRI